MARVSRTPPERPMSYEEFTLWYRQCLTDLAAGRHAVGCECVTAAEIAATVDVTQPPEMDKSWRANGCLAIARAALDGTSYEVEKEGT